MASLRWYSPNHLHLINGAWLEWMTQLMGVAGHLEEGIYLLFIHQHLLVIKLGFSLWKELVDEVKVLGWNGWLTIHSSTFAGYQSLVSLWKLLIDEGKSVGVSFVPSGCQTSWWSYIVVMTQKCWYKVSDVGKSVRHGYRCQSSLEVTLIR